MLQASILDGVFFDPFAFFEDGGCSAEVSVSWGDVFEAFMEALMVIVLDKGLDLGLKVAGVEVIFEQDPVFERLVPTLDFTLGLGMTWGTTDMAHIV